MPIKWPNIKPAIAAGPAEYSNSNGFLALKLRFFVPLMHTDDTCTEVIELHAHFVYGPDQRPGDVSPQHPSERLVSMLPPYNPYSIAVYLCGGPGDGNPAFANPHLNRTLLENNHAVLYVDYRGTGQSSPITAASMSRTAAEAPAQSAAQYLSLFRQDYIVADLEAIRLCLNAPKFSLVGQSFGGWIAMTYLSFLPNSLATVFLAGGLPPIGRSPEEVYTALYKRLVRVNQEYYARYPDDKVAVLGITMWLALLEKRREGAPLLPDGSSLTPRAFLTLGRHFGRGPEGYGHVHRLVNLFIEEIMTKRSISDHALSKFSELGGTGFRLPQRPLYGVLHEAIYCSGVGLSSNWAAQRVGRHLPGAEGRYFAWLKDDFSFSFANPETHDPLYFSGEMIYEFMLADAGHELEPFIEPAKMIAKSKDWTDLYDEEQLRRNDVFVRALVYPEDMFLDLNFSLQTAGMVRRSCVARAPRDWTHGSIRTRPEEVCRLLFSTVKTGDVNGNGCQD